MGAPSQTQIQNLTDRLAALCRLELNGYISELSGATNTSCWTQIDAISDPALVSALSAPADAVDRMSLPENYQTALQVIKSRPEFMALVRAISGLVRSSGGGSYASLDAYLQGVGATLHPLAAEIFRQALSESAFSASGDVVSVFAPNYQSRTADRVYEGADGSLADETTAASSATTADVTLFANNGDSLYVGSRHQFNGLVVALSTLASATIAPTVSYWNGNAWVAVTGLTDNTAGFTRNDLLTWNLPGAGQWVRTYKDGSGNALAEKTPLYWIKISRTASALVTPPVGTCIRIIPQPVLLGASNHLGTDQPPLALVRISAANTIQVIPVASVDNARFKEPGLRIRALTPIAGTFTLSLAYVDQAGAAQTQAQSGFASPNALDTAALTLAGSGARSVAATCTASTGGATAGVFEIYSPEARTPAL